MRRLPLLGVCRKCVTCISNLAGEGAEACEVPCEGAELSSKDGRTLQDAHCSFQSFPYDVTLTPQGIVHLRYAEMPSEQCYILIYF